MNVIASELRERTFRYSLRIIQFCRTLPDAWEAREMGRQLLRAGTGTSSNYRAACKGRSRREFVARLAVAAEESDESVLWLTLFIEAGIRNDGEAKSLLEEARQIAAILAKSYQTARRNQSSIHK